VGGGFTWGAVLLEL